MTQPNPEKATSIFICRRKSLLSRARDREKEVDDVAAKVKAELEQKK